MSDEADHLFERARTLPHDARAAYLASVCQGDPLLHEELSSLLDHADAAEEFFTLLRDAVVPPIILPDDVTAGSLTIAATGGPPLPSSESDDMAGSTVGRYRILSPLGRGGMGTVYLARDTRLDRQVALKFLRRHGRMKGDAEVQLLLEAQAAAGLEHPNVCTIHEVGETSDGRHFIAMSYYEGETLKQRLSRGPLPLRDAVAIAAQTARALAAAHARRIVHRDVKPGNIMLTANGTVRLLDFGLAALADRDQTRPSMTPGTIAYMSPEQTRGDPLDERTDLWSLGVVLYEMLSGVRPFRGATERALVRSIVDDDPVPISRRRPETPDALGTIVAGLLRKAPADRQWSAGQLEHALVEIEVAMTVGSGVATALRDGGAARRTWTILFVGMGSLALFAAAVLFAVRTQGGSPIERFGRSMRVTADQGLEIHPAISPDGRFVAYAAGTTLTTRVFVRPIDGGHPTALDPDAERPQIAPSWSPDGARVLFVAGGQVLSAPSGGGGARVELSGLRDTTMTWAAWGRDGETIAYATADGLHVRTAASAPRRVATLEEPSACSWAPDGRRIACASGNAAHVQVGLRFANLSPSRIVVVGMRDGAVTPITDGRSLDQSPVWSPDGRWLYFISDREGPRDVYAIRITREGGASGTPLRLTTGLSAQSIALSADGTRLVYSVLSATGNVWSLPLPSAPPAVAERAVPVTRGNQIVETFSVSADGRWLYYDSNVGGNSDLYRMRLPQGEPERLTTDPADEFAPAPSPDGREVAFHSWRSGSRDIYVLPIGGGPAQRVTTSPGHEVGATWSPDGRALLFAELGPAGGLWIARRSADGSWGTPVHRTRTGFSHAWSPTGELIAFNDGLPSGSLYVVPVDTGPPRRLVDATQPGVPAAGQPVWSEDGRMIYFKGHDAEGNGAIWSASVDGGAPTLIVRFTDPLRPSYRPTVALSRGTLYFTVEERQSDLWAVELVQR